ncbi:MAG: YggS family pyridoxal phosphate-dependent enzyme [Candidatus Aminicenantes bacterium]|nr:YggS family pyridoxal phosphate-dependent enzyme [Candidatus Aminicenantes bacterium]
MSSIAENVKRLLAELPPGVELVAAAKARAPEEVLEAVEAGVAAVGENYLQEAVAAKAVVGARARWHFIGHLQTNKARKAVELFDMIETVDSLKLAKEIDKRAAEADKVMPVLIEVNSGREPQKFGVFPEDVPGLVRALVGLKHLRVEGLMTMGPFSADPEEVRPAFRETRLLFEELRRQEIPGSAVARLSMGMSDSYRTAVEEGATIVRIGTKLFGPRLS